MAKKKTIGVNPLDSLIPLSPATVQGGRNILPSASIDGDEEKQLKIVKERLTVHLPVDLIERVKNVVYWTPGLTLAGLAEEAFAETVTALEKKRGEPYPPRKENLRGGRPMK
jgi:hypothetical protein